MSLRDVLTSLELLQRMRYTTEGFKIGECHDQDCILERSLWMLCGDLEFCPRISVVLWRIYYISAEIRQ